MEIPGPNPTEASENRVGAAFSVDLTCIVTKIANVREAHALPPGTIVGDLHGGLTFTDAVAAALESRSSGGWQEFLTPQGETWTLIILNR
jgi:crotonobetainyl-CoA:carnitine CoA-transferase CaiB-like acyl-CoA transferase